MASLPGLLTVFFSERPVHDLADAQAATCRPTPPGAGSCSRAASTRRRRSSRPGFLARPHRRAARAHDRGRRRGVRGASRERARVLARLEALLREQGGLIASLLPAQARRAGRRRNGTGPRSSRPRARARERTRGVRAAGRGDLRGLPAALRLPRAWCASRRPISACSPATACTRSASRGSSRSATWRRWRSSPT